MSIRIHHEALPGTTTSELSRAEEVSRSGRDASKPASRLGSPDSDRVEISSLSGGITGTLAAASAQQSSRVQHLAALYASGKYNVDSARVSRALVSAAIGSADMKNDQ